MNRREAERLARRIPKDDPRISVTGLRRWPLKNHRGYSHQVECVSNLSGIAFEVDNLESWLERLEDQRNWDALWKKE